MRYIRQFFDFLAELFMRRQMIAELTKRDFKSKYLGSYFGILWAFVHPTVYILIIWFVFQFGFKSQPVDNFPFVLWLMAGIIPWFFFTESIAGATTSVLQNSFLLKKVVFSMGMLPLVKILSALVIHLFFVAFLVLMMLAYGYRPDLYWLQLPYYLFSCIVFILGLSWITSSLVIFLRDTEQLVAMFLQFLFWLTPIFWSSKILPLKYLNIVKLNPAYYIVEGYRDCFINKIWIWQHWLQTLYFWTETGIILVAGAVIFRRLRPHFADVI